MGGHTGDKFWGGKANHLGNILMRARDEVRTQSAAPVAPTLLEMAPACAKPRHKGDSNRHASFQSQMVAWLDLDESPFVIGDAEAGNQQVQEEHPQAALESAETP